MTMKKTQILYAAAVLLFAACTSENQETNSRQQLLLSAAPSSAAVGTLTRAASGLYTSQTGFDGTETVRVWFNGASDDYRVTVPGQDHVSTLFKGSLAYPTDLSGTLPVYAVYPSTSTTSHTVAADQSQSETGIANYKASDLMYATATADNTAKDAIIPLEFRHQLVKLNIVVTKSADVEKVTEVRLLNVKRTVAVTPSENALTQGAVTTDGDNDYIVAFNGDQTTTEAQTYSVVFPAQTWDNAGFLAVKADGLTTGYNLSKNDWQNGCEYTINIAIDAPLLGSSVSIADWNPEDGNFTTYPIDQFIVAPIDDRSYTGSAITPEPVVTYRHWNSSVVTLVKGTDYTLDYSNNTDLGEASVYIIGKGEYLGKSATATFNIVDI